MRAEVKQDARGVWYARPYLGKLASGRVAKPYKSFPGASTREQAQAMADAWAAQITAGGMVTSMLLGDLLDEYNAAMEAMGASPTPCAATGCTPTATWRRFRRAAPTA